MGVGARDRSSSSLSARRQQAQKTASRRSQDRSREGGHEIARDEVASGHRTRTVGGHKGVSGRVLGAPCRPHRPDAD